MRARTARELSQREQLADDLLERLTPAMSALGIIFLLVVVGEQLTQPGSSLSTVLAVSSWVLWAVFVLEFLARMVVAPSTSTFLRRNWWQIIFLALPFLRVLRLLRSLRLLRTGRVLSSAIRSSRSARRVLSSRIAWLGSVTVITVLAASQLLYGFGDFPTYGASLHATALGAITGEPLARPDPFAQVVEVVLALYSVVVFATLAGSLGAFFLARGTGTPDVGPAATASVVTTGGSDVTAEQSGPA